MDHPTVDHGHGITRPRRKPPRRRCRPTSSLGRSDRPLALLLSSLFACSETLLSRFLVASQPVWDLLLCAKHLFVSARTVVAAVIAWRARPGRLQLKILAFGPSQPRR